MDWRGQRTSENIIDRRSDPPLTDEDMMRIRDERRAEKRREANPSQWDVINDMITSPVELYNLLRHGDADGGIQQLDSIDMPPLEPERAQMLEAFMDRERQRREHVESVQSMHPRQPVQRPYAEVLADVIRREQEAQQQRPRPRPVPTG